MIYSFKKVVAVAIIIFALSTATSCYKPPGGYNPYLRDKNKVSAMELKKQTKADRKARKAYRKQSRKTSMRLFGHKTGPTKK